MNVLLVVDTSALIALERVALLDLLPQLYRRIIAPPAVVAEFGRRPTWLVEQALPSPESAGHLIEQGLDLGEAEAIALAQRLPDAVVLIDEAPGRRVALRLGLAIIGTAGTLAAAKAAGLLPAVRPVLDTLRNEHDFRLADRHYEAVLREAGEL